MARQVILFDLDGTLTDSKEGILRCVEYALVQCAQPVPEKAQLELFLGPPLYDSFQQICGMAPTEAEKAVRLYRERFSKIGLFENEVYPGIPELLIHLRDAGKILAVATSKPEVYARRILEHFDLLPYFTALAGCDLHREGETKADMIALCLQRLGNPSPEVTVMVGDRKHDIEGARANHLPTVGVQYGYAPPGELEAYGAQWIVQDVASLEALLLQM